MQRYLHMSRNMEPVTGLLFRKKQVYLIFLLFLFFYIESIYIRFHELSIVIKTYHIFILRMWKPKCEHILQDFGDAERVADLDGLITWGQILSMRASPHKKRKWLSGFMLLLVAGLSLLFSLNYFTVLCLVPGEAIKRTLTKCWTNELKTWGTIFGPLIRLIN